MLSKHFSILILFSEIAIAYIIGTQLFKINIPNKNDSLLLYIDYSFKFLLYATEAMLVAYHLFSINIFFYDNNIP